MRLHIERLKYYKAHRDVDKYCREPTSKMMTDALTKMKIDPSNLVKVLVTGKLKERGNGAKRCMSDKTKKSTCRNPIFIHS